MDICVYSLNGRLNTILIRFTHKNHNAHTHVYDNNYHHAYIIIHVTKKNTCAKVFFLAYAAITRKQFRWLVMEGSLVIYTYIYIYI